MIVQLSKSLEIVVEAEAHHHDESNILMEISVALRTSATFGGNSGESGGALFPASASNDDAITMR